MTIDRKPSATAKAGLATGIIGTSLGALNLMGNAGGLLSNLASSNNACCNPGWGAWGPGVAYGPWGWGCSENVPVTRYDAAKDARIAQLETEKALRDANTFTDQKFIELYKYFDGELRDIRTVLSAQAVQNQKTADSFQMVSERMQCCCDSLTEKIKAEAKARRCADNTIVNYVNATFYPKQVADVTTGTTTTAQVLYNPLPAETCDCGCDC